MMEMQYTRHFTKIYLFSSIMRLHLKYKQLFYYIKFIQLTMSLKNVKIEASIVEEVKLLEYLKHPNLTNKIIGNTCYLQKTRL